jgi:hypothetical protein
MNTTDKIAIFALIIAFAAAVFSWFSFSKSDELARIAFNKNYRPYITASNFSFLNKDNLAVPSMNVIMIKILNAPAFITSKKLTFYTRENNIDSLLFEHPDYKNELIYPLDNTQSTIGTDINIISHSIAEKLSTKKIIRKIRIEYQWISDSDLKYYFESEWIYNIQKQDWDIISQSAN